MNGVKPPDAQGYLRSIDDALNHYAVALTINDQLNTGTINLENNCVTFSFGKHSVTPSEILPKGADLAFAVLSMERAAIYLMAVSLDSAMAFLFQNPNDRFSSTDSTIYNGAKIARAIRNAFTHDPHFPRWECDGKNAKGIYILPGIMTLDTTALNKKEVDRMDYGGPLALYFFVKHMREYLGALVSAGKSQ